MTSSPVPARTFTDVRWRGIRTFHNGPAELKLVRTFAAYSSYGEDNPMLRTTLTGLTPALDAALAALPASALEQAATSLAANTKAAYGPALAGLDTWLEGRPLDDTLLAAYLAHLVDQGCSRTAASEVVAAARLRARMAGTECPAGPATSYVLAGLGRRQPRGIGWEDLAAAVPRIEDDRLTGARDAAIIAVGSEVDLTVSEMIALNVEDLTISDDGTGRLTIRQSETDPEADEDDVASLQEDTVRRLRSWLDKADITSGPVFRRMRSPRAASDKRMTAHGIRLLVTSRAHDAHVPGASFRPLAMGRRSPRTRTRRETRVPSSDDQSSCQARED